MTTLRQTLCTLLLLLALVSPALAGPVRCSTVEQKTMHQLYTVCSDGFRAVSTYSRTLQRWETTITQPPYARDKVWPHPHRPRR